MAGLGNYLHRAAWYSYPGVISRSAMGDVNYRLLTAIGGTTILDF